MSVTRALPPIDPHRGYTDEQAAPYFGDDVSARQVRRWWSEGKLTFTPKPGGRGRVITGQQIIDYFAAHAEDRVA